VAYHSELEALAESLGLKSMTTKTIVTALSAAPDVSVLFLLSIPNSVKSSLLRAASLLVYTPSNEHFGIVPLEAMLSGTPVLAANTGGPTETILDGRTGWLRDSGKPEAWTAVMQKALGMSKAERDKMAKEGVRRVKTGFAQERMAERLDKILDGLEQLQRKPPVLNAVFNFLVVFVVFGLGMALSQWYSGVHPRRTRTY
jgi:alpha-1,3/alpha-1,6-mannosyltransferase